MPVYTYTCKDCEETADYLLGSLNSPAPKCSRCGSDGLVKQITAPNIGSSGNRSEDNGINKNYLRMGFVLGLDESGSRVAALAEVTKEIRRDLPDRSQLVQISVRSAINGAYIGEFRKVERKKE